MLRIRCKTPNNQKKIWGRWKKNDLEEERTSMKRETSRKRKTEMKRK